MTSLERMLRTLAILLLGPATLANCTTVAREVPTIPPAPEVPQVLRVPDAPAHVESPGALAIERPCFPSGECWRLHRGRGLESVDSAPGLAVEVGRRGAVVETVADARAAVPAFTDSDLVDVWVRDGVEAWAVGERVYHRTARGWEAVECGDHRFWQAVHGDAITGRVVAIGSHWMARIDGAGCEVVNLDLRSALSDVWVEPGGARAWAVGTELRVSWSHEPPVVELAPGGRWIAGRAADDVWATGGPTTLRFDGRAWRSVASEDRVLARIEPAIVDGEPVVLAASGRARGPDGWQAARHAHRYPEWALRRDVAVVGDRWLWEDAALTTAPELDVDDDWVGDFYGPDGPIAALATDDTGHASWVVRGPLARIDDASVRGWSPFRRFFWRREGQCLTARVTGVVNDGAGGAIVATQAQLECPAIATLLRVSAELVDAPDATLLPYPIRDLARLPDGAVFGLPIERDLPALVVDPRGRIRRVRFPRLATDAPDDPLWPTSACATRDGTAWIVDDRHRAYWIDRGARVATLVSPSAGADAVTCDAEGAWFIGCNGRIARCTRTGCVETPETRGATCPDPDPSDDRPPLAGVGPFHPFARAPDGRWLAALGGRIYTRSASSPDWEVVDVELDDYLAALGVRDGSVLVAVTRGGEVVELPLAALPLAPLGSR